MAALTSDMVWMVQQSVTLPGGRTEQVLVPVVYLTRANATDLKPSGALVSAENINLVSSGTLRNAGTLQAGNRMVLSAKDLVNAGNLRVTGSTDSERGASEGSATLLASHDFTNQGSINASRVAILAGNDATFQTTTLNTAGLTGSATQLARVSTVSADQLTVQADRDVSLQGAQIEATQNASLAAGRNLDVQAVTTTTEQHLTWDARNHLNQSQDTVLGSNVNTGGNLTLQAGQDISTKAANLTANGAIALQAGGDVTLGTERETSSFDRAHFHKSSGTFSSSSSEKRDMRSSDLAVGTTVSGDTVTIESGRNLTVTGSNVAGTGVVNLWHQFEGHRPP